MEYEITLTSLIQKGDDIKNGIYKLSLGYSFKDQVEYESWKNTVIRFLSDNYDDDRAIIDFESAVVRFEKLYKSQNNFSILLGVLKAIENVPQKIQKPTASSANSGINVNVNQSQQQTQQQTQSFQIFLEAIKDELTGKQQKELKLLAKEELPEAEKRIKIINKLKSFGSDILSNIIANVITNPAIWG